jgi:hypothetical protein
MPKPYALSAILLISCFSAACSYLPGQTESTQQPSLSEVHSDSSGPVIPVNLDNYKVAESDEAFFNITKLVSMNTFFHFPIGKFDLDNQTVVRMNRDTYYSAAIIDASEGATITIPETNGRYLSVMVVENDHYIPQVFLEPGTHEIKTATPFAMVAMRIRSNNNDPDDAAKITAIRDGVILNVRGSASHVRPNYDMQQLVALRNELTNEGIKLGSLTGMQGARGTVDPQMHLFGTAIGWGLLPDAQAQYLGSAKYSEDGCYTANYPPPPFNEPGFFSITIYDGEGWMYVENGILNEFNLEMNADGSFDAYFGECGDVKNNLPTVADWNYILRVYEPRLDELREYRLPEMKKVN